MAYNKKAFGYILTNSDDQQAKQANTSQETTLEDIRASGAYYYTFLGEPDACGACAALHGVAFHVSDGVAGVNFPPIHPNCKCDVRPYSFEDEISLSPWNLEGNQTVTPNDWIFYGWDGEGFTENPDRIYTDEFFGKPIEPEDYENLHIVDWIARILFHETGSMDTQAAILWCILNRHINQALIGGEANHYTDFSENTLINILNTPSAYEVFDPKYNNLVQPNAYFPLEWIENNPINRNGNSTMEVWENAVYLAKLLVSIYGNQELSLEEKRALLEQWVPNPFPETAGTNGEIVDPYRVTYHVGSGRKSTVYFIPVGDSYFGYTYE